MNGVDTMIKKDLEIVQEKKESPPMTLPELMSRDIPPIEYYASGILPKKGKGMISAQANIGKSIFVQNCALAMATGQSRLLDKFDIAPAKVLYLDLEMGESALKERFQKMCAKDNITADNLYVKYLPSADLLEEADRQQLEGWLADLAVDVLIIDPLGNAWFGNENEKEQVSKLTAYLNTLIERFGVAILVVHHWRKSTKDYRSGGQMAAGSYKWEAWLDCHITLEGASSSVTVSCQKSRNSARFAPFIAKIDTDALWFEFITDYEKKFTEETLMMLFEEFDKDQVAVPELIKKAKETKLCSGTTLRELIRNSTLFEVNKTGKTHLLMKKGSLEELYDETNNVPKGEGA